MKGEKTPSIIAPITQSLNYSIIQSLNPSIPQSLKAGKATTGFTMLELIVVLTLLVLITGAVVPLYVNSMGAVQIRSSRNNFISMLTFVQERAVAESLEYRVYIDSEQDSYWAMYLEAVEDDKKIFAPVEAEWGREQFFPDYLHFDRVKARKDRERHAQYIGCYPNGACDRATVVIQDERDRERRYEISTLGSLGKFEVED